MNLTAPFLCSICERESFHICVKCTKDTCANHLCEKCGSCSDCCNCELHLDSQAEPEPGKPVYETPQAT